MSVLSDIEAEIVGAIAALEVGGAPLFAEVRGGAGADTSARAVLLERLRTPAALVTVFGRQRGEFDDTTPSEVRVYVTVAERSLRSADGARVGDGDTAGVFVAAEQVTAALAGMEIDTRRLVGHGERVVRADARHVVIEQTWIAEVVF